MTPTIEARRIVAQMRKRDRAFRQRVNALHAKSGGLGVRIMGKVCQPPRINIRNWPSEELYLRSEW